MMIFILCSLLLFSSTAVAQSNVPPLSNSTCDGLPSNSLLEDELINQLAIDAEILVQGVYYTCQVQGSIIGTYQELSVIMEYMTSNSEELMTMQLELDCSNGSWVGRPNSLSPVQENVDYTNIDVRKDCSSCNSEAGNDHHCFACDSACNIGLMRCTGGSSSDCCVAFEDNGECSSDLNCSRPGFVANSQNNFTCSSTVDPSFTISTFYTYTSIRTDTGSLSFFVASQIVTMSASTKPTNLLNTSFSNEASSPSNSPMVKGPSSEADSVSVSLLAGSIAVITVVVVIIMVINILPLTMKIGNQQTLSHGEVLESNQEIEPQPKQKFEVIVLQNKYAL